MERNIDAGVLIKNISDAIESSANQELDEFGLTVSQFRYLEFLSAHPKGASAKDLRAYFRVSQPTVAGILKRLRAKGYVCAEISKADERTKDVSITQAGIDIVKKAGSHKAATEDKILSSLSAEEKETLKALLTKVYASFYEKE